MPLPESFFNVILPFKDCITLTDNHIQIGCIIHEISYWEKNIKKIGLENKYSEKEIQGVIYILKGLLKLREEAK